MVPKGYSDGGSKYLDGRGFPLTGSRLTVLAAYRAATRLGYDDFAGGVMDFPHRGRAKKLVIPAPELIYDFQESQRVSKAGTE